MELIETLEKVLGFELGGFSLGSLLSAALLAVVCLLAVKLLLKGVDRVLARSHVDATLLGMLRSTIKALLLFLALLMVMGCLGIPVTSLVAVLSVAGLAISLSIQNFLNNVAGGFQLLISHPFKAGDYVSAGGCEGTVQEIGLFYTKILTADNKLVQLPNSTVVSANITNYTHEPCRRVEIRVTASYDAPVDKVKESLLASAGQISGILEEPAPMARVSAYQDSAIEYILRVWCETDRYWDVYFDLLEEVKRGFDRDGIEMSYPHMNVHVCER